LHHGIASILIGKTVQFALLDSIETIMNGKDSFWKQFAIRICIFGTFFGQPGSMNDINIMNKSSIIGSILSEKMTQPACHMKLTIVHLIGFTSLSMAHIYLGPFFVR